MNKAICKMTEVALRLAMTYLSCQSVNSFVM